MKWWPRSWRQFWSTLDGRTYHMMLSARPWIGWLAVGSMVVVFGLFAWVFTRLKFPISPMVLGAILGGVVVPRAPAGRCRVRGWPDPGRCSRTPRA